MLQSSPVTVSLWTSPFTCVNIGECSYAGCTDKLTLAYSLVGLIPLSPSNSFPGLWLRTVSLFFLIKGSLPCFGCFLLLFA